MIRRLAALLVAALFLGLAGTGPAQAAGYRYWSFWDREGDRWVYATEGPSTARPADGAVQGFRFAVSEDSRDASRPRGAASFEAICARTPARDGMKRVALVVDFGTPADAPSGEIPPPARTACARVRQDATTAEALASTAKPLRYDPNALLCAISGYPESGCGDQVTTTDKDSASTEPSASSASSADDDGGPSVGVYAGGALIAALAAAAVWQARRRGNV
ncbi:SCO2322 family protein [Streptomyces sp. ID05-47C]|uniref:SCO2322 family protein n=1 Tax=Streptomyces sp. ID05-47C TaxID=3028665 RepID=UPI0029A13CE0|nr:SCO2322 family protein [Streptomyces sp. ID05-47C]MDX3570480.1 SCO2322 family protein [Streptomyces sp. ID05-47C]